MEVEGGGLAAAVSLHRHQCRTQYQLNGIITMEQDTDRILFEQIGREISHSSPSVDRWMAVQYSIT